LFPYTTLFRSTINDTAPTRLATAGTVGFTGYLEGGVYTYDNFTRTNLDGASTNPLPTTTGLSPASAPVGGPGFTLTVNGSGFISGSLVRWNGNDRPTSYVSATQLTAAVPATDLGAAGPAPVTVFNPAPGGGTSNVQYF